MLQTYDARNDDLQVWINGDLTHRLEARISPFDSLAQGGDGVWEGLRLTQGRIFKLSEHLLRLRRSARALAFTDIPSHAFMISAIRECLAANGMHDDVHIRLTLSRGVKVTSGMDPRLNQSGPTLIVLAEFKSPVYDDAGISLVTAAQRRPRADMLDPKIHHNNLIPSILAKVEANNAGADDALMLDDLGFVAETNATHFFHVRDGVLRTSTTRACPEGITRATVLELAAQLGQPVAVGDFSLTDAHTADEAFVTGTMGGLTPVVSLDGRPIERGPVTQQLAKAYADLLVTSGTVVVG
ncbi:branched-chain amino acid aminotransferase [Nocardioides albertanoniae]|uniref:Branched-chain amino acid aminotransferase n=1 Tax=Nocardioides albertanoniae TaxID=1175486 RepID=A0A543A3Q5_9ACTN|nr:aminotransferase class IV [Nocardioides albertanoniae]TQL67194.1 branched-chain amino acid aminotransferase [Nocardioides albertanoniae]